MDALPDDFRLPPLREDLRIESAAPLASGAPAWVIYDPARHRYFQIGRRVVEILSLWVAGTVEALRDRLQAERGFSPTEQELKALLTFLFNNELTAAPPSGRSAGLASKASLAQRKGLLALAKAYLFFRVPLVRPEKFLLATMPFARFIYSRAFLAFVVAAGILGLWLTIRQFDAFIAYSAKFISIEGAFTYAAAIFAVKLVHEMGHAYQATMRGVRVTSMGVAFMVLFPLFFTDVSDAWRRKSRRDKLMIDAGGVLMELGIAALATLLWVFLPDGPIRIAVFAIATTSWVLSLFVNLNPFMRFDGYYFLSDSTGVQNLQPRAFAMCRWWLREFLFGIGAAPPEVQPAGMRRFMIWYSIFTWIYRFFLFIGIAFLVFALFFKALGIILFVVEILFFIALPILKEIAVWVSLRRRIIRSVRGLITLGLFAAFLVWFVVPTAVIVHAPATLGYRADVAIYPSTAGELTVNRLKIGQRVSAGETLATIASPELAAQTEMTEQRIELLRLRLARAASDADEKAETRIYQTELASEEERLAGLARSRALLDIKAPLDGVVVEVDASMVPPRWIGRQDQLARIADTTGIEFRGYLSEDDLARVSVGAEGTFVPDDPSQPQIDVSLATIGGFAVHQLVPGYLASLNGGPIDVEPQSGNDPLVPYGSWFPVTAAMADPTSQIIDSPAQVQRGTIVIRGASESWARRFFVQIARVLIREFSA